MNGVAVVKMYIFVYEVIDDLCVLYNFLYFDEKLLEEERVRTNFAH